MYAYLEDHVQSTRCDSTIQALSWMGRVPEGGGGGGGSGSAGSSSRVASNDDGSEGWTTNHRTYYQEGWLGTGNAKGVVGVTFTACHCKPNSPVPGRTNYNLRGHRSEVLLVKWNEPYQKLATCDATGVIFVWIKHEGRWSIELINDRNSPVTDFCWSHDGRMALISYRDGFVLVGSVAGQRFWSSMLNLEGCHITCSVWSPDDQKVMFGTSDGQIVVMSSAGAMISQVTLQEGKEINSLSWNCEKFNLNEQDSSVQANSRPASSSPNMSNGDERGSDHVLAVCFRTGAIHLMRSYDDLSPRLIHTALTGVRVEWSSDGSLLAVVGFNRLPNIQCQNKVLFFTKTGHLRFVLDIKLQGKPVTCLTWGHLDRRLFIAVGCHVYTTRVIKCMAPLQGLCRRVVQTFIRDKALVHKLPLPPKLASSITVLFSSTIKGYIPDPYRLREFVCLPTPSNERLHCTMIRYGDAESSRGHYTLYLEYLGGLIPLLKGKRASKLRPEFIIFDPKIKSANKPREEDDPFVSSDSCDSEDSGSESVIEGCGSPRLQRKRRLQRARETAGSRDSASLSVDDLLYDDKLPETHRLVEVTSSIWGTKFKLRGLASFLPEDLGSVLYKTSLLHLQPRQMTINMLELARAELGRRSQIDWQRVSTESEEETVGVEPVRRPSASSQESVSVALICPEPTPISSTRASQVSHTLLPDAVHDPAINRATLSSLEIRTLESSPPQRRSPSFKNRSLLSPAEQQITYTSNCLISDAVTNGDVGGAIPKHESRVNGVEVSVRGTGLMHAMCTGIHRAESPVDCVVANGCTTNSAARNVVQLAARRIQESCRLTTGCSNGGSQGVSHWLVDDKTCQEIRFIDDDVEEEESPTHINHNDQQRYVVTANKHDDVTQELQKRENKVTAHRRDYVRAHSADRGPDNKFTHHGDSVSISHRSSQSSCSTSIRRGSLEIGRQKCHSAQIDMAPCQSASVPTSPVKKQLYRDQAKKSMDLASRVSNWFNGHNSSKLPVHPRNGLSEKDPNLANDRVTTCENYKNLETFQKAQFNKKLRKARNPREIGKDSVTASPSVRDSSPSHQSPKHQSRCSPHTSPSRHSSARHHVMYNKAPTWNENSQVYQLDFGGRVTQESAKNFQIELHGTQVMQFGRIESNAYTLDFQHPFSAIQAFAVALANVTQRLK